MKFLIEEFIEKSNSCKSREEVFKLYQEMINHYGFDKAVYTFVTDHPSANVQAKHAIQCNFPEDWMSFYQEKEYQNIDPVIMYVHRTAQAFSWTEMKEKNTLNRAQVRVLNQAEESGLCAGVGVPLYGPSGELAGIGLASSHSDTNVDQNTLSKLKLITEQFHLVYCSLETQGAPIAPAINPLSYREIEILKWWAAGKTADEIGTILTISEGTVKWHIKSIYNKLQANSKALAISKAIRLGYIQLDLVAPMPQLEET